MNKSNKPESFRISDYDETIRLVLDSGGEFCMYPRGKSMLPLIVPERDCVTLVKCRSLRRGDIALYRRENGSYILHRVIKEEKGIYTMCGDNQRCPETNVKFSQIIGKVKCVRRKGRDIYENNIGYRIYKFLIGFSFVRRLSVKLRRLKNGG